MKYLIGTFALLASLTTFADPWPYDPICRRFGATSETVQIEGQVNSPVVLCKFGISALIEKETLRTGSSGWGNSAVRAYRQSGNNPMGSSHCSTEGAMIVRAQDMTGRAYSLCRFFDDSIMEEQTFSRGPRDMFNRDMNDALGLPWSFNF